MTSVARRNDDSGEFSEGSQEIEHSNSGNEGDPVDSDYDTPGEISDNENPENQEPGTERRVDDDEDRSNPQYIPKRGTFYEHDDRTADNGEESTNTTSELSAEKEGSEAGTERRRPPRKSDVINKWSHDKFNENEQMPKSRDELVSIYGYDIRNEDAPPHARRNRRYGRGPNKYTRTWEDEEAYKRQTAAQNQVRKPPNLEDFPELDASRKREPRRIVRPRSVSQPDSTESSTPSTPQRRPAGGSTRRRPAPAIKSGVRATVRTPPSRHVRGQPRERESGDVRNTINSSRNSGDNTRHNDRNNITDAVRSGDVRNTGDVRNNDVRSGDVRNNGDVRNASGDVRNSNISGDVRNTSGDVRNISGDVRREKMPLIENLTIAVSNSEGPPQRKVLTPMAQQRPVPTEQAKKKPIPQGTALNNKPSGQAPSQAQSQKQPQPAGGPEARGSKRYSSLRQRPLADPAYNAQQQQLVQPIQKTLQQPQQQPLQQPIQQPLQQPLQQNQQLRYTGPPGGEFPPSAGPLGAQQAHAMHQVTRSASVPHAPSPPHQLPPTSQHAQQVRLGLLEQQQLVQHQVQQAQPIQHPLHNLPQQHAIGQMQPPLPPAQGYAPPAMMPAQYMQSGSGGVFPGAPGMFATPPAPYTHAQIYPHHNYATQAGGVTYFNCAEQDTVPRATRRPTAAIPIVKPSQPERAANSTDNDNIDRIVENMFVRKPWPAAHNASSKDKSQSERSSSEPSQTSQPSSLSSSSISTDSKPSESIEKEEHKEIAVIEKKEITEPKQPEKPEEDKPEEIPTESPSIPEEVAPTEA